MRLEGERPPVERDRRRGVVARRVGLRGAPGEGAPLHARHLAIADGLAQNGCASLRIRAGPGPGLRERVERVEPLLERTFAGDGLCEATAHAIEGPPRVRCARELRGLPERVEALVEVRRERSSEIEHLEQRGGGSFASVHRLEDATRGEAVLAHGGELLQRRARRPLLRIEGKRLLERVERSRHVAQAHHAHRSQAREHLRLLAPGRERGVLRERLGEVGPQSLRLEQRRGEGEHVAPRPEAIDDRAARGDRRGGVLRLARTDLRRAHQQLAGPAGIGGVRRALLQEPRVLLGIAADLVERRERLERPAPRRGREEPLVRGDGARGVLELRGEIGQLFVDADAPLGVRFDQGNALEDFAEAARVLVALVDLAERVGRDEDRAGSCFGRGQHARERRLRALRVAAPQLHFAELRARLRLDRAVLHGRQHPSQSLRGVGVALERRRERHVPRAQVVVGRVNREGLLVGVEGSRRVAEALAAQSTQAREERRPLRTAGAVELEGQVPRDLLGRAEGLERRRERRSRASGEALDDHELLRDAAGALVGRIEREQLLDVRQRALGLLQAIRVEDRRSARAARAALRRSAAARRPAPARSAAPRPGTGSPGHRESRGASVRLRRRARAAGAPAAAPSPCRPHRPPPRGARRHAAGAAPARRAADAARRPRRPRPASSAAAAG